ncbi:MAG: hypothetical protein LJD31_04900 [Wolbachia endosymbiont of Menacanthus eurysternus]|nr:hypothetical protein [Wolbachia endosymbiont of Menacanthus eurysternus]
MVGIAMLSKRLSAVDIETRSTMTFTKYGLKETSTAQINAASNTTIIGNRNGRSIFRIKDIVVMSFI